jgi:outer membrane usher protein
MPNIAPYRTSRVQVDGKSVPLNVRVDNTTLETNLARGSVAKLEIGVKRIRQLMLEVKVDGGSFATVGTSVLNEDGDFMGTVIGEGNVILTNEDIGKTVYLDIPGKSRCEIQYTAPDKFDDERPYEDAPATCV